MKCGANRWSVKGARLTLRRELGQKEVLSAAALLLLAGGLWLLMEWWMGPQVEFLVVAPVAVLLALYLLLARWQVTLNRDLGRISWAFGLGVPLIRRFRLLQAFDHVHLSAEDDSGGAFLSRFAVRIGGPSDSFLLAGTHERQDALALAQAVARLTGLALRVDGERSNQEAQVKLEPPRGSRLQVSQAGGQLSLELPAPGWRLTHVLQALVCLFPLGLAVAIATHLLGNAKGLGSSRYPLLLIPGMLALGGLFGLSWVRKMTRRGCRITVSREGLRMLQLERESSEDQTRIPLERLADIHVRRQRPGEAQIGTTDVYAHALFIESWSGPVMFGAGLSREELEWAARVLRQAVAQLRAPAATQPGSAVAAGARPR